MQFYGFYQGSKLLMWSLSTKTKDLWIENDQAFGQHMLRYRRKITFTNYFDRSTADYLLTENRGV